VKYDTVTKEQRDAAKSARLAQLEATHLDHKTAFDSATTDSEKEYHQERMDEIEKQIKKVKS
jgi:hypothetical protein